MNCAKNYTFDQFHQALSNTSLSREPGSKFEYSTFGMGIAWSYFNLKIKYVIF